MRPWPFRAVAVALALLCASQLVAAGPKAGRKPLEFKEGIRAQERGDWSESAKLMQAALNNKAEDGDPVRLYGTRFEPYLPRFYLGLALYKQGDCAGALREWEKCSVTIVSKAEKLVDLQEYMAECMERKNLPSHKQP